jgi:two-component sensor histidine kinase
MLAVVTAMSGQTLRRSKTLEEFKEVFVGRLDAMAAAYTLVSRESWTDVSLREILEIELRPYVRSSNTMMQGPEVRLLPRVALVLGMAAHELATNAVRHGALSVTSGEVAVSWHLETDIAGTALVLTWNETGGPPVAPPQRRGFGLSLLERSVEQELQGSVKLTFGPDGLNARFGVPLGPGNRVSGPMIASAMEDKRG